MEVIFVFVLLLGLCFGEEIVSVNTKLGVINGKVVNVKFRDNEYVNQQFLGIPYAKPPTGSLRFKKPEPAGTFDFPFDAFSYGSVCPQHDMMNFGLGSNEEDCLSLNIYVPTEPTSSPPGYAVMIFIHGGGFTMGAAKMLPGDVLSSYGNVILVTINYRLGIFGFASTGDDMAPGNVGFWDQRLAIQWVNENIEAFGGDLSRITIFGESAGSMSVYFQGMYPPNKGLLQNIIGQSGSPALPLTVVPNNKDTLRLFAGKVGCEQEDFGEAFECLRAADSVLIMDTLEVMLSDPAHKMHDPFSLTLDNAFIKLTPVETIARAKEGTSEEIEFFRTLRVINGVNSAEGAVWVNLLGEDGDVENLVISHEDMKSKYIPGTLRMFSLGKPATKLLHSTIEYEYSDWQNPDNARLQYVKFMGDILFTAPGYEWSLVHANSTDSKSWMYIFDAPIENNPIPKPSWVKGAQHADDLLPVFGYCVDKGMAETVNATEYVPPEWELDLSENMMTAWSNFAKYGDPNSKGSELWPQFTTESQKQLIFGKDTPLSVQQYFYAKEHAFWSKLVPTIMKSEEHKHAPESPFTQKPSETCDADGKCG